MASSNQIQHGSTAQQNQIADPPESKLQRFFQANGRKFTVEPHGQHIEAGRDASREAGLSGPVDAHQSQQASLSQASVQRPSKTGFGAWLTRCIENFANLFRSKVRVLDVQGDLSNKVKSWADAEFRKQASRQPTDSKLSKEDWNQLQTTIHTSLENTAHSLFALSSHAPMAVNKSWVKDFTKGIVGDAHQYHKQDLIEQQKHQQVASVVHDSQNQANATRKDPTTNTNHSVGGDDPTTLPESARKQADAAQEAKQRGPQHSEADRTAPKYERYKKKFKSRSTDHLDLEHEFPDPSTDKTRSSRQQLLNKLKSAIRSNRIEEADEHLEQLDKLLEEAKNAAPKCQECLKRYQALSNSSPALEKLPKSLDKTRGERDELLREVSGNISGWNFEQAEAALTKLESLTSNAQDLLQQFNQRQQKINDLVNGLRNTPEFDPHVRWKYIREQVRKHFRNTAISDSSDPSDEAILAIARQHAAEIDANIRGLPIKKQKALDKLKKKAQGLEPLSANAIDKINNLIQEAQTRIDQKQFFTEENSAQQSLAQLKKLIRVEQSRTNLAAQVRVCIAQGDRMQEKLPFCENRSKERNEVIASINRRLKEEEFGEFATNWDIDKLRRINNQYALSESLYDDCDRLLNELSKDAATKWPLMQEESNPVAQDHSQEREAWLAPIRKLRDEGHYGDAEKLMEKHKSILERKVGSFDRRIKRAEQSLRTMHDESSKRGKGDQLSDPRALISGIRESRKAGNFSQALTEVQQVENMFATAENSLQPDIAS